MPPVTPKEVIRRTKRIAKATALCLAASLASFAVINAMAEDNTTTTINGTIVNNNNADYYVGTSGTNNVLQIINGGQLTNVASGYVGYNTGANNNSVLVSGSGSLWTNSNLYVGYYGGGSQMIITNGGAVYDYNGTIGQWSSNNVVLVTSTGSLFYTAALLHVGSTGGGNNQLIVTNGGRLISGTFYVGDRIGGCLGLVSGTGSVASVSGTTYVEGSYSSNSLFIINGGLITDTYGTVGDVYASNAIAVVSGPGSVWSNSSTLSVPGFTSQLIITNGGKAISSGGYLGWIGTGSVAVITGANSIWTNSGDLTVGYDGGGSYDNKNQLIITNGGQVFSAAGLIGKGHGFQNTATISGTGSIWSMTSDLFVGYSDWSISNQLNIVNGGRVINSNGIIANNIYSSSNTVLVSGAGSLWSNSGTVYVGYNGYSNNLVIANGGTVAASNVIVGYVIMSSYNLLSISGGNLYATNAAGNGSLDLRHGSVALNSGTVVVDRLYDYVYGGGVITFSAGLLRSGGSAMSNGFTFAVGDGVQSATFDMLGGTHSFAGGLSISTNGSLIGNGSILGSVTNFGVIAPGHSFGVINISGDLALNDPSTLSFKIGGTSTNSYDQVFVGGILRIAGLLNVTETNGYTGNVGDTFTLLHFSSETGAFSQTNLPTLSAGEQWDTSQLYTLGTIEIVPEPGTWALLALGMSMLVARRRKK